MLKSGSHRITMNFYFEAAKALDRLDAKKGSIKGVIGLLPEKDRKRTAALVIETLKCGSDPLHIGESCRYRLVLLR